MAVSCSPEMRSCSTTHRLTCTRSLSCFSPNAEVSLEKKKPIMTLSKQTHKKPTRTGTVFVLITATFREQFIHTASCALSEKPVTH